VENMKNPIKSENKKRSSCGLKKKGHWMEQVSNGRSKKETKRNSFEVNHIK
jgi:hypothetical protein